MNADNMAIIKSNSFSKTKFYCKYEEQVQILNDQKTVIGVEFSEKNNYSEIVIEDITNTNPPFAPVKFSAGCYRIYCIVVDENMNCMFTGSGIGDLVQYSLDIFGHSRKIIKNYGNLGIGCLLTYIKFGNIVVFGGNRGSIAFIDFEKRKYLGSRSDIACLLYTSPSPRDLSTSRMPSSA